MNESFPFEESEERSNSNNHSNRHRRNQLMHHRSQSTPMVAAVGNHILDADECSLSSLSSFNNGSKPGNTNSNSRRRTHRKSNSSISNDSHNELLKALERTGSFYGTAEEDHENYERTRPPLYRRWTSDATSRERIESNSSVEKKLQFRRSQCESSIQKLYNDRKDHIFELFQDTWVISDPLEEEY